MSSTSTTMPSLNRGDRVRHTESWACGEVLRADPAACVVRWDDGSECWALRGELEPWPPRLSHLADRPRPLLRPPTRLGTIGGQRVPER